MENNFRIIGILIKDRIKEAGRTQKLLSRYAGIIRSRLGFHEVSEEVCSRIGMIILHLSGTPGDWQKMKAELDQIGGIEVQTMKFNLHQNNQSL